MAENDSEVPIAPPLQLGPIPPELINAMSPFAPSQRADPAEEFRVSELSQRGGVPIGTIKYYLREGLLPPGRAAGKTQALYTDAHVRRLRLIRVLGELGGMSVEQIKSITTSIDAGGQSAEEMTEVVAYSLETARTRSGRAAAADELAGAELERARRDSDGFVAALGINASESAPGREQLARALVSLRSLGLAESPLVFTEHAIVAYELAKREIEHVVPRETPGVSGSGDVPAPEDMAVGIVVFGAAFMALRALSAEHEIRRHRGEQPAGDDPS